MQAQIVIVREIIRLDPLFQMAPDIVTTRDRMNPPLDMTASQHCSRKHPQFFAIYFSCQPTEGVVPDGFGDDRPLFLHGVNQGDNKQLLRESRSLGELSWSPCMSMRHVKPNICA